jgi:hypothetical protein
MGWDYITYGEQQVCLYDMELWALRHFLANAAGVLADEESLAPLFAEAKAYFAAWDWPGPGVVTGIDLDEFVRGSGERERVLVRVCDRAVVRLREFGEVVPLHYLKAHVNADSPGGRYVADRSSACFVEEVERIRSMLIAGSAEPGAAANCGA